MAVGIAQFSWNKQQTARQLELSRQKVRLDLFDRRFAIYTRFREVQRQLIQTSEYTSSIAAEAIGVYMDAVFLFPPDVVSFLHGFQKTVLDLYSQPGVLAAAHEYGQAEIAKANCRQTDLMLKLSTSYAEADQVFRAAMYIEI